MQRAKRIFALWLKRIKESDINAGSVRIAYFVTLSLFPMLLTVGTLLPYFHISAAVLDPLVNSVVPEPLLETIRPILDRALQTANGGLLTLGIVVTIWSASAGMKHVQAGVDCAYGICKSRRYLPARFASIISFIVVILLLLIYMVAYSFGEALIQDWMAAFDWTDQVEHSFQSLKLAVPFLTLFVIFILIYKFTPNIKHRFRDVLAGSLFATLCVIALVQIYALYLRFSTKALSAYGILSAFFVLLIWIRLLGYVILLGASLNAALFELKYGPPHKRKRKVESWLDAQIERVLQWARSIVKKKSN